jgi:diguanylate cyclase
VSAGEPAGLRAYEIARAAIEQLCALGLAPNAVNIAVWMAHLEGGDAALSEAVTRLSEDPAQATPAACHALYIEHLMENAEQALELSDLMSIHLKKASSALAEADQGAASYGAALEGVATALDEPIPALALQKLVMNLSKATDHMRARTVELENKLAQTSDEVTSLRDNLLKVREEALTDPLTGLANRKQFNEFLESSRQDAARRNAPLTLILCDIDHFKLVNDTWGHTTGDGVIRYIASVLKAQAKRGWLVARHGGEEFAIVAPNTTLAEGAQIADAARREIASKSLKRRSTGEALGTVTASFGVAQSVQNQDVHTLIERADESLYASKDAGRNRVSCSPSLAAA